MVAGRLAVPGVSRRLALRSGRRMHSGLPPPPPPFHQYYGHQDPQHPHHVQHTYPHAPHAQHYAAPAAASAEAVGSWKKPLVVEYKGSSSSWVMDVLRVVMWTVPVFLLYYYVSSLIAFVEEEGPASGSSGSSDSSAPQKSQGALFGMMGRQEPVKPVDLTKPAHNVQWGDVHGCDEAKEELKEVVEFLKDEKRFTKLGGRLPKGFLLVGPPGTGKTMLAKAVAREANVPFFYASGAQFDETFVGVGAKRVRELFNAAKERKPCIIFIDEIDAVGSKRSKFDTSNDRATINQLLSEMDGFHGSESVIVLAATNSPQSLDKALTRPGRFDRQISVDPPDMRGRVKILEHYLTKVTAEKLDAKVIARGTNGMVGADLANIVNLATLSAAKEGADAVGLSHLEEAKDRVSMGMEQKSRRIPEHERRNTAYHEAGHALVAIFTDESMPLHKATIRPRGQALGLTMQLPPDDQISQSLQDMHARLRVLMGGRIAEELVFGRDAVTTGASNDIQQATALARAMVRKYGLSAAMGCVDYSFADDPEGVYLSNKTRGRIEEEVKNLLDSAYRDATDIIVQKRSVLEKIALGLLEKDTLTGAEMREMAGKNPPER